MFVAVAIDVPLHRIFTYAVPEALRDKLKRGARVLVPFGRKDAVGFCLGVNVEAGDVDAVKIKAILDCDTAPLLDENYLKWLEFAADYYVTPLGQVLGQTIPSFFTDPARFNKSPRPATVRKDGDGDGGGSATAVSSQGASLVLNPEQQAIIDAMASSVGGFAPALIHGVTGSGKTEVYMELIAGVLARARSAIVLVPEIGLTPQTVGRLNSRFKGILMSYHSALTPVERARVWLKVRAGGPLVLIGTRSALFAPFANLGLIIVDEEHDTSYKQEDRFRYNARDLALARGHYENIPVVLGSATPSLESYHRARQGHMRYFKLAKRAAGAEMPWIEIVDSAREHEQTGSKLTLTHTMIGKIAAHLNQGDKVILFSGQRGYAQNAFCTTCHVVQACPNCSVGMKFHVAGRRLKCHYCDFEKFFDEICNACGQKKLTLVGSGSQSVEEELATLFPQAKIQRVDSDAFPSPKKLNSLFDEFRAGKIDIIVGTQMMSKGHDFAGVGFVGVAGIDAQIGLPDFRAAERCFQTVVQVAGRAGRRETQGRVLVQSLFPQHQSLKCALSHDYERFAEHELASREKLAYPPFCRLIQIRFLANVEDDIKRLCADIRKSARDLAPNLAKQGVKLLGPSEMPIAKLRGKYRAHMILKLPRQLKNSAVTDYVLGRIASLLHSRIQTQVDVDPVGLV